MKRIISLLLFGMVLTAVSSAAIARPMHKYAPNSDWTDKAAFQKARPLGWPRRKRITIKDPSIRPDPDTDSAQK